MVHEVFVSYAWGGESEEIVNELEETFKGKGITLIRDKTELGFKGIITDFMNKIGEGKAVIVVISHKYLESPYCMYELLEIYRHLNFVERIFPIVLSDANIFEPKNKLQYLQYWEDKKDELGNAIIKFGADAITAVGDDYKAYKRIFDNFGEVINTLKDINALTPEIHRRENYKSLIHSVDLVLKKDTNSLQKTEPEIVNDLNYAGNADDDYSTFTLDTLYRKKKTPSDANSFVNLLLQMQRWELEKISTSSVFNQSIVAHIEEHYTKIPLQLNSAVFNADFSEFVAEKSQNLNGVLAFCIGHSGCGKSTLLINTLINLSTHEDKVLPIYINLNNAAEFNCDRMQILRIICNRYKIEVNDSILNNLLIEYRFIFLLDGLDEKSALVKIADIEKAISSRTDDTFIISCRSSLYRKLKVDDIDFLFEFKPINAEMRVEYFYDFFDDKSNVNEKLNEVANVLGGTGQDDNVFSNILMLTLLAMHIKASPDYLLQFNKRRGTLIDSITTATINREIKKNKLDLTVKDASAIIEYMAFLTYERGQNGQSYSYDLVIQKIKDKVRDVDILIIEQVVSIFVVTLGITKLYKFVHSQFLDFFIAKSFFNDINKKVNIDNYLAYSFSTEINALLSDLMRDTEPSKMYKILERKALKYLDEKNGEIDTKGQSGYEKLFLLIMHMQRTGEYNSVYLFAKKLLDSGEKLHPFVELMLLHSKVVGGLKEEDEEIYFQKLLEDDKFQASHLGTLLVYYNKELEFKLPHYDDYNILYKGSFYAYSQHFLKSDKIKHYYIVRRHNMFAIRKFLERRRSTPEKVSDFYKSIKKAVESDTSTFGLKVKAEYDLLIKSINKYPISTGDF